MWTSPLQGEWLALRAERARVQAVLLRAIQVGQRARLAQERLKQARAVLAQASWMRATLARMQAPERVEPPLAEAARRRSLLPP